METRDGSAVGMLRLLVVASLVVPAILLCFTGWFSYEIAFEEAGREASRLCEITREHTAKVFNSQELVVSRVADRLASMDDAAISRSELMLHDELAKIIAPFPQIHSLLVIDSNGRALLSTGRYPVSHTNDFSDREYFKALKSDGPSLFLSRLQTSHIAKEPFFGLGQRLMSSDGGFRGVVEMAILPSTFEQFWKELVGNNDATLLGGIVALVRTDGAVLAIWPTSSTRPADAPSALVAAMARSEGPGTFTDVAQVADPPGAGTSGAWRYTFCKVPGYRVATLVGRSERMVREIWARQMLAYLALGIPGTAALCLLALTALRRARQEEAAVAQLRSEMRRREAAEAAAMQAQRMEALGQLTGGVAHDFNNLLTIMIGNFEMIALAPERHERTARLAKAGMAAAHRGAELTARLLSFSRRRMVRPEIADVNRVLEEFEPVLRQSVTEAIAFGFDLAPDPQRVMLDPGQLEAAVLNLTANARDVMNGQGTIRVSTGSLVVDVLADGVAPELAAGGYVRVAVADDGPGMSAAVAARAFEPFFTTKEAGRGTGLGLSQVYNFCRQAGGIARILSVAGQGTTVEMLLPRAMHATPADAGDVAPAAYPSAPDGGGQVVLVVEDNRAVLESAVASLTDLGYASVSAVNAEQALTLIRSTKRIDILFSDVVMPGGDGLQLGLQARLLRPSLRILLTSGYAGSDRPAELPPDVVVLSKPYFRDGLAAALARLS